ncbi:Por secretion system C-terminal sorting domain-containing protein [bacterium A37T11]|nr:Por secretion system C-terminal sorting domain-containing protein [bacterium A37T11]
MGKYYIRMLTLVSLAFFLLASHQEVWAKSSTVDTVVNPAAGSQHLKPSVKADKPGLLKATFSRIFNRSPRVTENDKLISRVKVFPNPVSDQINLSFNLGKDNQVSIKVMDALGNEITTLLSQRLSAGEQNHTFSIQNKLSSGYYFIRVVAGSETVIKRISVV